MDIKTFKILNTLSYESFKISLFEPPLKTIYNRNIICEDYDGNLIWQVGEIISGNNANQDVPFTSINYFDEKRIIAYNWIGAYYYITIKTGEMELANKNWRLW
jgi:hypothetical protein